jgi:plasmid stability protein
MAVPDFRVGQGHRLDCYAIIAYAADDPRTAMASITIRNLDDGLKRRLRVRAAEHGRSMEEEAREILRQAVGGSNLPKNLGQTIHSRFAAIGGVELAFPVRGPMREPPSFR